MAGLAEKYKFRSKNGDHARAEELAQEHLKETDEALGDLPQASIASIQPAENMTLRQQKEAELKALQQQFMNAKMEKGEFLEAAKLRDQIMTETRVLISYIEQDVKRLPPDPTPKPNSITEV